MDGRRELDVAAALLAQVALELRRAATLAGAGERHIQALDAALRDLRDIRRRLQDPDATPTAVELGTRPTLRAPPVSRVPTLPSLPPPPPMRKP